LVKNNLGQYFTTNTNLKQIIFEFILNKPTTILEPSIGRGDLVEYISNKIDNVLFEMYEIDENINFLKSIKKENIKIADFLKVQFNSKFKTIIGNPPYVKTNNHTSYGNLYIDFIAKCFNLLELDGELIFIIPSDFFKLTSAINLLNLMYNKGNFTHIYHPHNEKLFENASIDIVIFRYQKTNSVSNKLIYITEKTRIEKYIFNSNGMILFYKKKVKDDVPVIKDVFNIHVGMVSGKESVFKNKEFGNLLVLNSEKCIDKYILINKFPTQNPKLNDYLLKYKQELKTRKIRKFNENNWFEWGALRNVKVVQENLGKECIYVYNLSRRKIIAFKDKVSYFGGNLIIMIPKDKIDLDKIVDYLNTTDFKENFTFSNRFKIGQRQLENSPITY
jgi:adenine-specific DNA-methyltransferase